MTAQQAQASVGNGLSEILRRHAGAQPSRIALIDGARTLTWRELDTEVTATAASLRGAGLCDGDRVAVQLGTGVELVLLYLGAWRAGLVSVLVDPSCAVAELTHLLADSGARLLISPGAAAPPGVEIEQFWPAGSPVLPGGVDPRRDRTGEDVAVLLYTSGTTGSPKGAMLSARALCANLAQLAALDPPLVTASDVGLVALPLSHIYGLNAALGPLLDAGATAVLVERFEPRPTLELMARHGVTTVAAVPGMFAAWAAESELARGFASVRLAMSGAASLSAALVRRYAEIGVTLFEGYGLTEAGPVVCVGQSPGVLGRPLPGVEVQLRDPDGAPAEDDPGEVWLRGQNLFSGYWPDGAGGPDEHGWFGTGDLAVADEHGVLAIVGRSGDLVIVNGFNVYPAEVEAALRAQPGVRDVAVTGVEDEQSGEAVVAFVVPAGPVESFDVDAMLAGASHLVARFKLPRAASAVEVVTALPRTATGKVMKWRLGCDGAR